MRTVSHDVRKPRQTGVSNVIRWIQPGETGVDFSYSKPPPARLVELGYTFVVGYISPNYRKNLLNPQDYIDAGLGVLYVYEVAATTPNGGRLRGLADGAQAKFQLEALGQPHDVPFLVAFDTNTNTTNIAAHIDYFNAVAETAAPYFCGAYEDTDLAAQIDEAIGWLPLAWSWSGGSKADAEAKARALGFHVLQQKGYWIDNMWAVDPNLCIRTFTTWGTPNAAPPALQGVIPMDVVTNAEASDWAGGAGSTKFALQYAGQALYHLSPLEWKAGGSQDGVAMSDDELTALAAIPAAQAPPGPAGPAGVTGPTGPQGPPGPSGTVDEAALVAKLKIVLA